MNFSTQARWIWNASEESPRNFWLRLRHVFSCAADLRRATLLITADSRYEVYLNGKYIGNGPVRSFPWSYSYDQYDITSWLLRGAENVVAAHAVHWGDHTFQYIRSRAGFLCEIVLEFADGRVEHVVSDELWYVSPDPAIKRETPRISIQLPFEEQYDARLQTPWLTAHESDKNWERASVIGPVDCAPWTELTPRTIPFLTQDVVQPTRILALELAQTLPGYRWCFDLRHRVKDPKHGLHAELAGTRGQAFITEIIAPHACTVSLFNANGHDYQPWHFACNGQEVQEVHQKHYHILQLHAGPNLFVLMQTDWPSLFFQTEEQLHFDASHLLQEKSTMQDVAWAYLGPFDERDDTYTRIRTAVSREQLPDVQRRPIFTSENLEDIFLCTKTQRFLLPAEGFCHPSISNRQAREVLARPATPLALHLHSLLSENANYTVLYPQREGAVHLVLDFGREVVGFPLLEIDAPAGTIVDANFFEGIDDNGIFWTNGLRNSFRYICRDGYQLFRSSQRRGFRYVSLTFHIDVALNVPVKLYTVRCLLNTYPVEQRGSFVCSDALLTKIWEVAAYTVCLCMEDTYVDCPAYEQVFWVGDARNSALVNAVAFGAYDLTTRSLGLTAQSLSRNLDKIKVSSLRQRPHLTSDHVVSGRFSEIPMWTFLWIWNVLEHYQITGESAVLVALYPAVRECLQRCLSFLSPRGLFNMPRVWNLVDWSAMDVTRDGEVTSSNALLVESLRRAAMMADHLVHIGEGEAEVLQQEATSYRNAAKAIYQALNTYCWSEEQTAYVDTVRDEQGYVYHVENAQKYGLAADTRERFLTRTRVSEQTNTLVLLCSCAPPERAERVLRFVEASQDGQFVCSSPDQAPNQPPERIVPVGSPWFLFFTLETLVANRQADNAISLMRKQWGRMIEKGATTFWETFPDEQGEHWSRSLCHGWSAAPAYFLSTLLLGVQPVTSGYGHVRIAPQLCGLDWVRGSIPTPQGEIFVSWTRNSKQWSIEVSLPPTVSAELLLANVQQQPDYVSGVQGTVEQIEQGWRVVFAQGGMTHYSVALP